jgi:hypothetical protein
MASVRPNEEQLPETWFDQPPKFSVPPPSLAPPRAPATRPGLTSLVGAVTGLFAGTVFAFVAPLIATQMNADASVLASTRAHVIGAVAGAAMGVMLGLAMMHSERRLVRVVFATAISASTLFCVHVAMLYLHSSPLPLLPMLASAALFGALIGCIPPFKRAA